MFRQNLMKSRLLYTRLIHIDEQQKPISRFQFGTLEI